MGHCKGCVKFELNDIKCKQITILSENGQSAYYITISISYDIIAIKVIYLNI